MLKKFCLSVCLFVQCISYANATVNNHLIEQIPTNDLTAPLEVPFDNAGSADFNELLLTAKSLIGTPYRAGGTTPNGFDCSGFVQYVFRQSMGVDLPRTSRDMATVGERVSRDELQLGDMVFFAHSGSRISHVGMYVGDGQFIHSPSSGKTVEITSMHSKYWQPRFITARRLSLS